MLDTLFVHCSAPDWKLQRLAAGDALLQSAVTAFAPILTDAEIAERVDAYINPLRPAQFEHGDAARAVARHAAWCGLPAKRIARLLARLSILLPGSPVDPSEIAAIVRTAIADVP